MTYKKHSSKAHSLKASLVTYQIALASESIKFYVLMLFARLEDGKYIDDVTRKAKQYIFSNVTQHLIDHCGYDVLGSWVLGTS